MKRINACLLALALVASLQLTALAAGGFFETGGYTVTEPAYTIMTSEAVQVYNKEVIEDPNYSDIWSGSSIYVPIYRDDDKTEREAIATAKQIKDDKVEVSYKATKGDRYIKDVTIVDGKKDKIKDLPSGAYVKIEISDNFSSASSLTVEAKIVLSVNKVSYQESRVTLECQVANRLEYINDNSVYGAQVPTRFRVDNWYKGEATFDMGDGVRYTARVSSDVRYSIDFTRDPDYDIDLMYPDAYLEFYNFRGNNDTFASVGSLVIPINTKKFQDPDTKNSRVYAYEVLENNRLKALGSDVASYDSRNKQLTIKTQTLGHYVLSNIKLRQEVDPDADQTFQSGYALDQPEEAIETTSATGTGEVAALVSQPEQTQPQTLPQPVQEMSLQNPETGGGEVLIHVSNGASPNPPTGPAPLALATLLGCVSGAGALAGKKNKS